MATKKIKQPPKDTWVRDVAGTNKKVDSYIKSQGGNEWDIAGFKQFMDHQTARTDQQTQANNNAVDTWNTSRQKSLQQQAQQEQKSLNDAIKKSEQQRKQRNLIPQPKKNTGYQYEKPKNFLGDLRNIGKMAVETINPFDNVDAGQALQKYADAGLSKGYKEVQRGANRAVDSASFSVMSNLDKKMTGQTPDYLSSRKVGEGGVTDFITSGLGYLVPGTAEYKALNGMKAGKALTQFGAKGFGQRLASEAAKGAIVGAGTSIPEVGVRYAINPQDQNLKENLKYIGTSTALGAVADPLFYGAGKGFSKGMESASNKAMKNLLPKPEQVQQGFNDVVKLHNAEHTLPIQNKNAFNNLIPTVNNTNPTYALNPTKSVIPQIGKPKELPPIDQLTLSEQLQMINKPNKNLPDFSYGKPVIERNSILKGLLPQSAERNIPDFSYGKPVRETNLASMFNRVSKPRPTANEFISNKPQEVTPITLANMLKNLDGNRKMPDYSFGKQTSEAIPPVNEYGVEIPFDKVVHAPADYWRGRYEDFANYVNSNYDTNQLTPEVLNDLWSQFARYDEPVNLEQLIELAHPTTKETPVLDARNVQFSRKKPSEKAKKIIGIDKLNEQNQEPLNANQVWNQITNRQVASNKAKNIIGFDKTAFDLPNNTENKTINSQELWDSLGNKGKVSGKAKQLLGIDETAFNLHTNQPINTADVWDKMGNRPHVSQNAKNILMGQAKKRNLVPNVKPHKMVQKPLQPLEQPINTNIPEPAVKSIETPANSVKPPVKPLEAVPKQPGERAFYSTVQNPEKLTPELQQRLNEFDKTYKPMSNEELVNYANKYVSNDMEKAYQFVKNARKFDPRHITVGHRLIDELQKAGEYDRALDVVERLAEQGTKAGQSIQSYSIYNRLTPEGQLLRAQRHVNKINANIADTAKQVKLTEQNVQEITQTADSIRRFTGQEEQANNVIKIMDSIKKGNQPTDAELETVRSFVSDAKKFVSDLEPGAKPKAPKPIKDVRTRDKVVDFMSKREEVARQRLRQKMNRANSLPVDVFYDLSIIGASKIAKGTVKVADFTEEMAKEFGEMVRPYAQQIYNKAVETFNLQSESMTRQRLSEVEKITNKALKDKNLDVDQADAIREFARQVGLMSGDAKLENSMELQSILQALDTPTFGQKLSATQTIAQLLNLKTVARNAIGNELFYRTEQLNKLLATPVDILRSKITGAERTVTFISNNQSRYWKSWFDGAKAGWKGVNPMGLTTAYDLGPQAFRSKFNPLTYLEKSLGATLRSFDHAGYMRAYNQTLGEMATVRAMNEGLTGQAKKEAIQRYIREADENMIRIADQYGKYATFQDNTALSTALSKVKKGLNKVSTLGATEEFGLGDLVLKYPKTPGNIIMRALEYSPAGLVRSAKILSAAYKTKDPFTTKEGTLAITRAIMGTAGFSLLGALLADKGILTSSGNSDLEVSSLERNAGKQPNSVNISALGRYIKSGFNPNSAGTKEGDTFVSYDWAQPISMAVALGTGINQSIKENGKLNLGDATKGAFDSASNTIINQSVLQGLNSFLANYPGRTMSDRIGDAAKGIAGSFIPTLSNQARQLNDNTARSTYSPNLLPEIKNRATNRIPGLEKTLPPSYDTLGNKKQTYQNNDNNPFNVLLNPSFVSSYKPSPEAKFLVDFINKTGDKTLAPRMPNKKLDGTPLTSKQYAKMQKIMGQETQKGLHNLLPSLQNSSDQEAVRKKILKILTDAGKKAREEIRAERGE